MWPGAAQGLKALFPAKGGPGAVEVTPSDLARLDPEEFLNDTMIDFYMQCAPAACSSAPSTIVLHHAQNPDAPAIFPHHKGHASDDIAISRFDKV